MKRFHLYLVLASVFIGLVLFTGANQVSKQDVRAAEETSCPDYETVKNEFSSLTQIINRVNYDFLNIIKRADFTKGQSRMFEHLESRFRDYIESTIFLTKSELYIEPDVATEIYSIKDGLDSINNQLYSLSIFMGGALDHPENPDSWIKKGILTPRQEELIRQHFLIHFPKVSQKIKRVKGVLNRYIQCHPQKPNTPSRNTVLKDFEQLSPFIVDMHQTFVKTLDFFQKQVDRASGLISYGCCGNKKQLEKARQDISVLVQQSDHFSKRFNALLVRLRSPLAIEFTQSELRQEIQELAREFRDIQMMLKELRGTGMLDGKCASSDKKLFDALAFIHSTTIESLLYTFDLYSNSRAVTLPFPETIQVSDNTGWYALAVTRVVESPTIFTTSVSMELRPIDGNGKIIISRPENIIKETLILPTLFETRDDLSRVIDRYISKKYPNIHTSFRLIYEVLFPPVREIVISDVRFFDTSNASIDYNLSIDSKNKINIVVPAHNLIGDTGFINYRVKADTLALLFLLLREDYFEKHLSVGYTLVDKVPEVRIEIVDIIHASGFQNGDTRVGYRIIGGVGDTVTMYKPSSLLKLEERLRYELLSVTMKPVFTYSQQVKDYFKKM